jgi:hypothetical protein
MDSVKVQLGLTDRTTRAIGDARARRGTTGRTNLLFAGPAVVAWIAYMDPGNFATNLQACARYGYALLWVVPGASAVAMLFRALSAKLGIVTNRNLAETCRERFPAPRVYAMWGISEIAAMATGHPVVGEIETAYHTSTPLLGAGAGGLPDCATCLWCFEFGCRNVGAQMITQGFVSRSGYAGLRRWCRRSSSLRSVSTQPMRSSIARWC